MSIKFLKSIAVILIAILLFVACGKSPDEQLPNEKKKIEETDISLVEGGVSDYKIVLPENPHKYENFAADELKGLFYQATDIKLPIVSEKDISIEENSKLLILGESRFFDDFSIEIPQDLKANGFIIKRNGNNVFMCGGDSTGTVYAVYEFLKLQFSYEVYSLEEIYIEKEVREKKLLDLDYRDEPDFSFRQSWGRYSGLEADSLRLRLNNYDDIFVRSFYQPWHNIISGYFPKSEYLAEHPKWYLFEGEGDEMHYTAHGDEAELALMRDTLFEKMKSAIIRDFEAGNYYEIISVTQRDNMDWAGDGGDTSVDGYKEKYGDAYPAATLIHFLNPVAKRIKQFMAEEYPGREMNVLTFAYHRTEVPPVKYEGGKWVPIDDTVVCEDNMIILYAPIRADFTENFNHKNNESYKLMGEQWNVLCDKMAFWIYTTTFNNMLTFYDSFYSVPDIYKFLLSLNGYYIFNESFTQNTPITFNAPKEYLYRKLQWDTELDPNELMEDFFDNYYKDVSDSMYAMFQDLHTYYAVLKSKFNLSGYVYESTKEKRYWEERVLDDFLNKINDMYKQIEPLKIQDSERYYMLYDRICCESIMFRYIKLLHYSNSYTKEELKKEQTSFKEDCLRFKLDKISSLVPTSTIWENWDI